MGSVWMSLGLVYLVREWLPVRWRTVLVLPRRQGRLVFEPRRRASAGPRLSITYLGPQDGQPRLRLDAEADGKIRHIEVAADRRWDLALVQDRLPELRDSGASVVLEALDISRESLRLRITSSMSVSYEGGWDALGVHVADALVLPEDEQQLVEWLIRRREVALADVMAHAGQDQGLVRARLRRLVQDGYVGEVEAGGETRYRARLARRRGSTLPESIWRALEEDGASVRNPHSGGPAGVRELRRRAAEWVSSERGRFVVSVTPVWLVFVLGEWLLLSGGQSFAAPLSFGGVITATLAGGIFPVLMLIAARRKAELLPGLVLRFLGHPITAAGIYAVFVTGLLLHGLVIWTGAVERVSALAVGLLAVGVTLGMLRRGAFTPRAVVELRDDQREGQGAVFAITVKGEPASAQVRLRYADGERTCQDSAGRVPEIAALRQAIFEVPTTQAKELKVWAHQITREQVSGRLPAVVDISCGGEATRQFDLRLTGEQIVVPLTSGRCTVQVTLR
jgi:hypothetical protein